MKKEHLTPYLPYDLKIYDEVSKEQFEAFPFITTMMQDYSIYKGNLDQLLNDDNLKLVLRPLSDIVREIEHNSQKIVPVEYYYVGDDDNYTYEFDSGNLKLIRNLITIAKHNTHYDINFLPFEVVRQLIEWHFDVFGLIPQGKAVDINTIEK